MKKISCSQCGGKFAQKHCHQFGYSHCSDHRKSDLKASINEISLDEAEVVFDSSEWNAAITAVVELMDDTYYQIHDAWIAMTDEWHIPVQVGEWAIHAEKAVNEALADYYDNIRKNDDSPRD